MKQNNTKHHLEPLADYVFDLFRQGEPSLHLNKRVIELCATIGEEEYFESMKFKNGSVAKNSRGEIILSPNDYPNCWIARPVD